MNLQQQTAAAAEFNELWRAVMPKTTPPSEDQFLLWAGNFTNAQVMAGINGAARKLRAMQNVSRTMTPDDVARYASSIMTHEARRLRRHTVSSSR